MKKLTMVLLMGIYLLFLGIKSYEKCQANAVAHNEEKEIQFLGGELEKKFYAP
ncbi:hypothetical protein [Shivajiella indica]|uniref:Uncharacterized protein n=1 Tax=Shivajiella indica TaxID=872115 RepID=A0ABW5BAF5_9BACT